MSEAVYGQSLYLLAKEEHLEEEILQQLRVLAECFDAEPDYLKLLASHDLSKQERTGILDRDFGGKVNPYVLNFLKLLTEKGYIRHVSDCCKAYRKAYNADKGILEVRAVTAMALTDAQKAKLAEKLTAMTGKTVELGCKIDPAVLGGVRLQFDGQQVDGTVQSRLAAMEKQLKNTVL
jgi:F-type H+-transporting ATPase subunit delta